MTAVRRGLLHPLAPTLVLAALTGAGAAAHSGAVLAATAGAAAGFANSGST